MYLNACGSDEQSISSLYEERTVVYSLPTTNHHEQLADMCQSRQPDWANEKQLHQGIMTEYLARKVTLDSG